MQSQKAIKLKLHFPAGKPIRPGATNARMRARPAATRTRFHVTARSLRLVARPDRRLADRAAEPLVLADRAGHGGALCVGVLPGQAVLQRAVAMRLRRTAALRVVALDARRAP